MGRATREALRNNTWITVNCDDKACHNCIWSQLCIYV